MMLVMLTFHSMQVEGESIKYRVSFVVLFFSLSGFFILEKKIPFNERIQERLDYTDEEKKTTTSEM